MELAIIAGRVTAQSVPNASSSHSGSCNSPHKEHYLDEENYAAWMGELKPDFVNNEIAESLGVTHLGYATAAAPTWPVIGKLINDGRPVVSLMVQGPGPDFTDPPREIIFLVATGSLYTYLSEEALNAFGTTGAQSDGAPFSIHGITVDISYQGFMDINVLGMDFLSKANLAIIFHSPSESVALMDKSDPNQPKKLPAGWFNTSEL